MADGCPHSIPACRYCRPHPWRPWSDPKAWKPEPFPGACGDCAKPQAEHDVQLIDGDE